jgi:hypothetical protein
MGAVIAVIAMLVLGLAGLCLSLVARRSRAAFDAQVARLASLGIVSSDYARGLVSLSWAIGLGLSLVSVSSLWTAALGSRRHSSLTIWVLFAGVVCIDAALVSAWFMRPKWAIPPHARQDPSAPAARRARRDSSVRR